MVPTAGPPRPPAQARLCSLRHGCVWGVPRTGLRVCLQVSSSGSLPARSGLRRATGRDGACRHARPSPATRVTLTTTPRPRVSVSRWGSAVPAGRTPACASKHRTPVQPRLAQSLEAALTSERPRQPAARGGKGAAALAERGTGGQRPCLAGLPAPFSRGGCAGALQWPAGGSPTPAPWKTSRSGAALHGTGIQKDSQT